MGNSHTKTDYPFLTSIEYKPSYNFVMKTISQSWVKLQDKLTQIKRKKTQINNKNN
jgi:hypothetical protein